MTTYTALTTLADEARARALGEALERLDPEPTGVGVFEMEDGSGLWEVGAYFDGAPNGGQLALLEAAFHAEFAVSELPETDWVAKVRRELSPVEAGRFFVYGKHDEDKVPVDRVALRIEASMAFGTGHHGTTLGCLRAFDRLIDDGIRPKRVADIGCGTAVLAMAAAQVCDASVVASDIDEVAIEVALSNLEANGLSGRIDCVVAEGFDHPALTAAPFDLIFANILKGPLIGLAPDIASASVPGGMVILSGILNEQADDVVEVYAQFGLNLVSRESIVDWTTLVLGKHPT